MIERDWACELERHLQRRFAEWCQTIGQSVPVRDLRISPPLGAEESQYFLLGLEAGFFLIDEEGYVQSDLFPPLGTENGEQKIGPIFWRNPSSHLFREGICQLATASFLILKRGWQKRQIVMEPSVKEHRSFADGVDILVKSPTGRILVCVEVKRSIAELQKLAADFQACCKRGPHASTDCAFEQNHPSYEFCASCKPIYFWAVAPEANVCFRMSYNKNSIEVVELESLPQRSVIESIDCRDHAGTEN